MRRTWSNPISSKLPCQGRDFSSHHCLHTDFWHLPHFTVPTLFPCEAILIRLGIALRLDIVFRLGIALRLDAALKLGVALKLVVTGTANCSGPLSCNPKIRTPVASTSKWPTGVSRQHRQDATKVRAHKPTDGRALRQTGGRCATEDWMLVRQATELENSEPGSVWALLRRVRPPKVRSGPSLRMERKCSWDVHYEWTVGESEAEEEETWLIGGEQTWARASARGQSTIYDLPIYCGEYEH